MSYSAVGGGSLALRFNQQSMRSMRSSLCAHYNVLLQAEQQQVGEDALKQAIYQRYQAKKLMLENEPLQKCLSQELCDAGFSDIYFNEIAAHQRLHIETSFAAKYFEERIESLLELLAPYTIEGEFSFRGEDDGLWRLLFTGTGWTEQDGEIVYTDRHPSATPAAPPYPFFAENEGAFSVLLSEIQKRMQSDERSASQRGNQLLTAFREHDPDSVLAALTNLSLQSLGAFAGIWQSDSDGLESLNQAAREELMNEK